MKNFKVVDKEYVNPVDLTVLGNTFNTLEQGNQKAVAAAAELETAMANLDLNEAESEWRQQKINDIRQTIEDNSRYGNAYFALDDIIKKSGNIASDAGMIGRLQAQKDYKAYLTNLDKRDDIPEEDKEYFREINQYYYKDKYNDKGQVIGGTKWQPLDREVSKHIPMSDIFTKALTWAAKESGGYQQVTFLDVNGNPTTDPTKSSTGDIYTKTTTGWVKLSKDKLRSAIEAAINSTPGARESIAQDYKIDKWRYDKNGSNPNIVDKNGYLLTPEQYLEKRINPFIDAAQYYNQQSETEYGDALKAQIALSKQYTGNQTGILANDVITTLSNPITIKNTMPIEAMGIVTRSKQTIADILGEDINVDGYTYAEMEELLNSKNLSTSDKIRFYNALDDITENQTYIDSIKKSLTPDKQDQFETYNAITSLSDLPNNKYSKGWSTRVNSLYDGAKSIRQYFANSEELNNFYVAIGGKNNAISLGIKEGAMNGKSYVELPASYNKSLLSFAKAGSATAAGSDVVRVKADNTEERIVRAQGYGAHISGASYVYYDILNYYNDLQRTNDDVIGNSGNITLSNAVIAAENPTVAKILAIRASNPTEANKWTQVLNDEQTKMFKAASNIDLVQTGAFELDKNNTFKEVDTERRKELTALLRSAKEDDLEIVAIQDPKSGNWGAQITIKGTIDETGKMKREPITFYSPGGIDSKIYESWNNDTKFRAKNDINKYKAANRDITIVSPYLFGGDSDIKLRNNGNGFDIIEFDKVVKQITDEEAINLRDNYYIWRQTLNALRSGMEVNSTALQNIMLSVANTLASIHTNNPSEQLILYYYNNLLGTLK